MEKTANPLQYSAEQKHSFFTVKFSYFNRMGWVPRHMWRQEYQQINSKDHCNYEFAWERMMGMIGEKLPLSKVIIIYENIYGTMLAKWTRGIKVFVYKPEFINTMAGNRIPAFVNLPNIQQSFPLQVIKELAKQNATFYRTWKENLRFVNDMEPENERENSKLTPMQLQDKIKKYVQLRLQIDD